MSTLPQSESHTFLSPGLLDVLPTATDFFNATKPYPLTEFPIFMGSGVYGLYYKGDYKHYSTLASRNANDNFTAPIYIGKAIPAGGRTGIVGNSKAKPLYGRLEEHRDSIHITHAHSLEVGINDHICVEDFYCRFMIIPDEYWPLIASFETALIIQHQPLWNIALSGFGIHNPGIGRKDQKISAWDTIHPGRKQANSGSARREEKVIFAKIQAHLAQQSKNLPGLFDK